MRSFTIKNATIITPDEVVNQGAIQIEHGIITRIGNFDIDLEHPVIDAQHRLLLLFVWPESLYQ